MALTLVQAEGLSNNVLRAGVIETIVKESSLFDRLPFVDVVGNALSYVRESTLANVSFFLPGDEWTESTPGTGTQQNATLKILGGDADVDKFLQQTRSNVQDLEAVMIELKAKALAHTFQSTFVYGNDAVDPKSFDGAQLLTPAGQRVNQGAGTTPAALSLKKLDEAINKIRPGLPDLLMMTRRTRSGLSAYSRALTSPVQYSVDEFGRRVGFFDGIPIAINDFMTDTESIAGGSFSSSVGGASSSILAFSFGEGRMAGLQNGGVQIEDVGSLETKDARRWRCKWYCGLALFDELAIAIIDGISSADVVA